MRKSKFILIALSLFFLSFPFKSPAQPISDSIKQKVDRLFAQYDKKNAPGAIVSIVRNDSVLYSKSYGLSNLEYEVPNSEKSVYYVCSLAKQFTAYAVILLAKAHKLSLDDDIRSYLQWLPDFGRKITIRNLLHHTSGIRDDLSLLKISGIGRDGIITQQKALDILGQQRTLNFLPGEAYSYSNSNYILLAEIVKTVSGQSFQRFTDSAIFTPLHMPGSHFYDDPKEIIEKRALSYQPKSKDTYENSFQNVYTLGDGGLFMPMEDMERWVMNLFNNKIGDSSDIALMNEKGKLTNGKESSNTTIQIKNQDAWVYNGGLNGYKTLIAAVPRFKTGFIIFANNGDDNIYNLYRPLFDIFIDVPNPTTPITVKSSTNPFSNDSSLNHKLTGDYIGDDNFHLFFYTDSGKLYFQPSQSLIATSKDIFSYASDPSIKFVFGSSSEIAKDSFVNIILPQQTLHLTKYALNKTYTDEETSPFIGTYYCEELRYRYQISRKEHKLFLSSAIYSETPIDIWNKKNLYNSAVLGHLTVLYSRDHTISGFEINNGTLSHLLFNRIQGKD